MPNLPSNDEITRFDGTYSKSNLLMNIVNHQLFIGRWQWPCCYQFKFVTDNVAHINERNTLALSVYHCWRQVCDSWGIFTLLLLSLGGLWGGSPEKGFCFQSGLPYFLMFVVTSQLVPAGCWVLFLCLLYLSVHGKFLLSVVGCCLLIAYTQLSCAAVSGSFWFLVVSCQLLHIDCW